MSSERLLKGKSILVVEAEPDILKTVAKELDICLTDKAQGYEAAVQYLAGHASMISSSSISWG